MLTKTLAVLPILLAACATDAPSGSLPEGRYQLSWTCLDPAHEYETPPLVAQHQLVVLNGQLAFDQITIPIEGYQGPCACTLPIDNIPAFMLCADDSGRTMSGAVDNWAFTATSVVAR